MPNYHKYLSYACNARVMYVMNATHVRENGYTVKGINTYKEIFTSLITGTYSERKQFAAPIFERI